MAGAKIRMGTTRRWRSLLPESRSIRLAFSCWPSPAGLLFDFKQLKQLLQQIVEHLDHPMINNWPPFTGMYGSAENPARYILERIRERIRSMTEGRVDLKNCLVFETGTSLAAFLP